MRKPSARLLAREGAKELVYYGNANKKTTLLEATSIGTPWR